jgi:uncharacterized membrane protein
MTYKEWESELLSFLQNLPKKEKNQAVEYYREMYGDKIDAGMSNEDILKNFGSPRLVAARILMESATENESKETTEKITEAKVQKAKNELSNLAQKAKKSAKGFSVSKCVGWFFITLLVLIPLFAVVISLIASLSAVTVAAGACALAGALASIASPFAFIFGHTGTGVLSLLGTSLCTAGVGALLFAAFLPITKYTVLVCIKITKYALKRRESK